MFTPYNISPFSSLMPRMDSTFFIFELRFHKAPKIYPKPLCYVAPRGWFPPPRDLVCTAWGTL